MLFFLIRPIYSTTVEPSRMFLDVLLGPPNLWAARPLSKKSEPPKNYRLHVRLNVNVFVCVLLCLFGCVCCCGFVVSFLYTSLVEPCLQKAVRAIEKNKTSYCTAIYFFPWFRYHPQFECIGFSCVVLFWCSCLDLYFLC